MVTVVLIVLVRLGVVQLLLQLMEVLRNMGYLSLLMKIVMIKMLSSPDN